MTLKNIKQEAWMLPPAEHIQKIIVEDLKLPVTFEVLEQDARFAAWDLIQAAQDADAGESPTQLRSYLLP